MYLWMKALHLIAVICWFAALFYLPRLFVYHASCEDEAGNERFKIMERKLYWGIMTPSAIASLIFGIILISMNIQYYMQAGWMHGKLTCILVLIIYHLMCGYFLKQFRKDVNTRSHVFFRWFNEFPVLLLFVIVILAVVKPL